MADSNFAKDEPVLVTALVGALVSWALSLAVTHGWLATGQASSLAQQTVPELAAAICAAIGLIARRFVSPTWKLPAPAAAPALDLVELAAKIAELVNKPSFTLPPLTFPSLPALPFTVTPDTFKLTSTPAPTGPTLAVTNVEPISYSPTPAVAISDTPGDGYPPVTFTD